MNNPIKLQNDDELEKISAFVDRSALARTLNVSIRTIENWDNEGLPHYQITSHTTRYNLVEVDEWLNIKRVVNGAKSKIPRASIANIPEISVKGVGKNQTILIAINGVHFEVKND
jgi:hypothetical protein